jgi:hypothetical protein
MFFQGSSIKTNEDYKKFQRILINRINKNKKSLFTYIETPFYYVRISKIILLSYLRHG